MIRRLLIANRGEIAVRIARAAREAEIEPLGIYSDADHTAYHLSVMARSALVGPPPANESYLNIAAIIAAARELGADAVHPGYGFLSERAAFAQAVIDSGMTFVGPTPAVIEAMGSKAEAKQRVRAFNVPTLPGYDDADQSVKRLRTEAKAIGTPFLVKASAGGGGRGMRVVADMTEFEAALEAAQREAKAAFSDDRVILERYLKRPRHIEFQILGDHHGTILHIGERECSIQRRHQKIVEEAPSPALDARLRSEMGAAAVRAAQSVKYTNAGTVEFLLDEDGRFYFLEMNTRLQVEHPVTEEVYGIDLVRWQFAIADGKPLTIAQDDIKPRGWAIECRIYAEDPARGMLPSTGTITRWEPPIAPGIRLDSGVRTGSDVSLYYDPMLAKLIAYGQDRAQAIARLGAALADFGVDGVRTNIPLLAWIARDDVFRSGETTTAFLSERFDPAQFAASTLPQSALLLAVAGIVLQGVGWRIGATGIPIAFDVLDKRITVRASHLSGERWRLEGDVQGDFTFARRDTLTTVAAEQESHEGRVSFDAQRVMIDVAGRAYTATLAAPPSAESHAQGSTHGSGTAGLVEAPMPGKVLKIATSVGKAVAQRDLLIVLEAMKMEHRIEAPLAGKIAAVHVTPNQLVAAGAALVEIT